MTPWYVVSSFLFNFSWSTFMFSHLLSPVSSHFSRSTIISSHQLSSPSESFITTRSSKEFLQQILISTYNMLPSLFCTALPCVFSFHTIDPIFLFDTRLHFFDLPFSSGLHYFITSPYGFLAQYLSSSVR